MGIVLKSEREIAKMRGAGEIVRTVLDAVEEVPPGRMQGQTR